MSQTSETRYFGRAGWFAAGALVASLAFLMLLVGGDLFKGTSAAQADSQEPALVIEGN